ncbi:hypothetical protein HMPREF9441_04064, partial [Paraprevotella clara YIT 11840]
YNLGGTAIHEVHGTHPVVMSIVGILKGLNDFHFSSFIMHFPANAIALGVIGLITRF